MKIVDNLSRSYVNIASGAIFTKHSKQVLSLANIFGSCFNALCNKTIKI